METKLIIGKKYIFGYNRVGTLRKTDDIGAYFEYKGNHNYDLTDGLIGFPIAYAENFNAAEEQPEDLHETQKKQILDYLKTGKSITKLEALKMFGCWNSGDVIHKLRNEFKRNNEKFSIEMTMITNGKKRFASYKLIENV